MTARRPLVAFNLELDTPNPEIAREVAARLREAGGGLPGVRALGLPREGGRAQVSINVHDADSMPLARVVEEVRRLAAEHGARPVEAELVGLAPASALEGYPGRPADPRLRRRRARDRTGARRAVPARFRAVAQTKRKRRRKHRGTQGGRVDDRPRRRPANRAEARQQAKARRGGGGAKKRQATGPGGRPLRPPSWSRAIKTSAADRRPAVRDLRPCAEGAHRPDSRAGAPSCCCFYIPMSYYLDRYMYGRRLAQIAKEHTESKQRD